MTIENLFVFGIPLIAKKRAQDWQRVLDNLQATLQSILNQRDPNFQVFIATDDEIELPELRDARVKCLPTPDRIAWAPTENFYNLANQDASFKRALTAAEAVKINAGFIMYADADDLVSNCVVGFVRSNPHPIGYVLTRGYVMDYTSGKILACPSATIPVEGFDSYCGTSIIHALESYHSEPVPTLGHNLIGKEFIKRGTPLFEITEPMAIYVLDAGENISMHTSNNAGRRGFASQVVEGVRSNGLAMSRELLSEFGLLFDNTHLLPPR